MLADSQVLAPVESDSVDLVYGRYIVWFEDLEQALRAWYRVTRPGGRLLISIGHPLVECLEAEGGTYRVARKYHDESPLYDVFTATPLGECFGGWQGPGDRCVEFFHPTWRIVNAILDAGYQLLRMEEPTRVSGEQQPRDLPSGLYLLARKPGP